MILLSTLWATQTGQPTLTVVLIAYNAEKTIQRTIDSILTQNYTDFRILCMDDGSTDATTQILRHLREIDSRVRALRQRENLGVLRTRLAAIRLVETEYFLTIDADDELASPDVLWHLVKELEKHSVDILHYCEDVVMLNRGRLQNDLANPKKIGTTQRARWLRNYFLQAGSYSLVMHGKVFKTDTAQAAIAQITDKLIEKDIRYFEDALILLCISQEALSYRALQLTGYVQYQRINSLTEEAKQFYPKLRKSTDDLLSVIEFMATIITQEQLDDFQFAVLVLAYGQLRLVEIWDNQVQKQDICSRVLALPWIISADRRALKDKFCSFQQAENNEL